jgi:transcriptional regulator with XRE-family HTH domain
MPPADTAARLANALGVTVEYLLNGQDTNRESTTPLFSSPRKRTLLRLFDELLPQDQKLALDLVKLLRKNRDEQKTGENRICSSQ